MNVIVCMKQTFDTEAKIALADGKISEEGVQWVINPYDEYAIEEALKIKEATDGNVTIVTIGPARVEEAVRTALAMGADDAVIVDDPAAFGDEFTVAEVLAAVIKTHPFDLILTGNQAVDDGSAQVAVRLAERLDLPHVSTITKLTIEGATAVAERDAEGDTEVVEVKLPALFTAQQGLNEPRYPSLLGIRKASKKPVKRLTLEEVGLSRDEITKRVTVTEVFMPAQKGAGRILTGDTSERVRELVRELRQTSKVI
ncbi:electron transfer flavoprotein subunit beta/FixA family protein [Ferroacidibacillus organovorans]|uniref:Electron transfer flavoprotein subunit beta n=1 Tax=Ferroacidibacillus organovorans TaxID=1765683 RepID=A0A101XP30_9BACL|nr:electron transfer flavoprotein subunit beta/FixA family protein [Ferroacidibacillus organovorans]KUO94997.1 electron transfer flavoprotein subunit beta [Ferroacidibacillus organovorans]